jgi:NAD(P)-dependent dehydrogenase (short-subunit alcohol dehydrogenase family)
MADKGGGAIINVTTLAASKGMVGATAYASSKAAVNELTRRGGDASASLSASRGSAPAGIRYSGLHLPCLPDRAKGYL